MTIYKTLITTLSFFAMLLITFNAECTKRKPKGNETPYEKKITAAIKLWSESVHHYKNDLNQNLNIESNDTWKNLYSDDARLLAQITLFLDQQKKATQVKYVGYSEQTQMLELYNFATNIRTTLAILLNNLRGVYTKSGITIAEPTKYPNGAIPEFDQIINDLNSELKKYS